jgi:hypothetical protein
MRQVEDRIDSRSVQTIVTPSIFVVVHMNLADQGRTTRWLSLRSGTNTTFHSVISKAAAIDSAYSQFER